MPAIHLICVANIIGCIIADRKTSVSSKHSGNPCIDLCMYTRLQSVIALLLGPRSGYLVVADRPGSIIIHSFNKGLMCNIRSYADDDCDWQLTRAGGGAHCHGDSCAATTCFREPSLRRMSVCSHRKWGHRSR
jgi:hypothetical protein